jgi:hypothetical protein
MTVGGLVGGANILDLIFGGKNIQVNAGRIDGKNISHARFLREREIQLNRMRRQGQEIDNRAYMNAGDFAWNTIIERELKDEKIKQLGLEVSLDEIYDFLVNTPPAAFKTDLMNAGYFSDEEGNFDTATYEESVTNGTIPVELNPLLVNWENYLRIWLADRKLQTLYNNLGSVNDEQVKREFMKKNQNCTLDYLYVTISSIPDSLIEVSESAIESRYNEDREDLYSVKDRRTMEYVLFQIPKPVTAEDSLNVSVVEDSVMQSALDFTADAEDFSFVEALSNHNLTSDTIDVHETFEANSGIPFQMGVLRPAVRFAFDNSMGSLSDPLTAKNGIAVFHLIGEKEGGYKPLEEVSENIRRTLTREFKKEFAEVLLKENAQSEWGSVMDKDSLLLFTPGETQTIGGSFPGIGKSNELTGTLLAMQPGETSPIVETFNAVSLVKMTARDAINDSLYEAEFSTIRNQLLNTENSRGFSNWLTTAKKNVEQDDYRSEVY